MEDKNEHLRLAKVVKETHADLRKQFRTCEGDFNKVWEAHCSNEGLLSQYADAMHHLAVDHWTKHPETRIEWCRDIAVDYFLHSGLERALQKDARRQFHKEHGTAYVNHGSRDGQCEAKNRSDVTKGHSMKCGINEQRTVGSAFEGPIRLLDVGSCFNPFLEFEEFLAVGIDISPAKSSVHRCDFLLLELSEPLQVAPDTLNTYMSNLREPIERIPRQSFNVVVFSLLLEYFPAPYQRWICCQKAHDLLSLNGLLLIITPDSHKQHRNAPMMKSWKTAIESMGFSRWKYVKQQHIHCMAFRKIPKQETGECSLLNEITPDMLYIPQDFNTNIDNEPDWFGSAYDEESFRRALCELPVLNIEDEEEETELS